MQTLKKVQNLKTKSKICKQNLKFENKIQNL